MTDPLEHVPWEEIPWTIEIGDGPLIAAAIHEGHQVRPHVLSYMALHAVDRLREEDPFTNLWTEVAPTRVVGYRSRFEFDLNRPRDKCVYRTPEDCWGLEVWREPLPHDEIAHSVELYDKFYEDMRQLIAAKINDYGIAIILDLHSYNHRRGGPDATPALSSENPMINIGTGTMNRDYWAKWVDRFIEALRAAPYPPGPLDVRENIRFFGGHFSQWVHETFPTQAVVLSIEVKKFFMDEWTGVPDMAEIESIREVLEYGVAALPQERAPTDITAEI